ncbi:MAG TPA: protein kinase [Vicinamibacterales bacterium]|nr:protein kinase [Vicinamibacterales bacterium]
MEGLLGAGGMGEVYRARDTRLGRDVAVKVLPPDVAKDPERIRRFEQEARAAAALNHANICTLYDVGEHDGTRFLLMELVDGRTLTELIPRDGLPLDRLLRIAVPLADAVGAAHARGIVHRDLKPANVMVTFDGRVKVLDFGLAKLKQDHRAADGAAPVASEQLTGDHRIIGTVSYMSPEQAEGLALDHRSDVFSLGSVLFEMATGTRPFRGETAASIISSILKDEPAPMAVAPELPRGLDRIIRRCLAKDRARRYQSALDLAHDLEDLQQPVDAWTAQSSSVQAQLARVLRSRSAVPLTDGSTAIRSLHKERLVWMSIAALAILFAAVQSARGWWLASHVPTAPEMRLQIVMPSAPEATIAEFELESLALSPDGRRIVFVSASQGRSQLWLRSLDSESVRPLAGTDFAILPFWSPDSRSVAFFADRQLKRIDIDGDRPRYSRGHRMVSAVHGTTTARFCLRRFLRDRSTAFPLPAVNRSPRRNWHLDRPFIAAHGFSLTAVTSSIPRSVRPFHQREKANLKVMSVVYT